MLEDLKEIEIGRIAKNIILREMKRLDQKTNLTAADIGSLEKLTKLYCSLMDDMRRNLDSNLIEKLQKTLSK